MLLLVIETPRLLINQL